MDSFIYQKRFKETNLTKSKIILQNKAIKNEE